MQRFPKINMDTTYQQVGSAIDRYNEDQSVRDKWDYLHTRLRCCGAYGYEDYLVRGICYYYGKSSADPTHEARKAVWFDRPSPDDES